MNKLFSRFLRVLTLTILLVVSMCFFVFAGTAVLQFSDPTVTRGKTVQVNIKVKSSDVKLQKADLTVSYDATKLEFVSGTDTEGGAGTLRVNGKGVSSGATRQLEYQLKFNTLLAGVTNLEIVNQEVYDNTENLVNITKIGSSKVTIKPANSKSKNANLKELNIHPGELDKTFDASVLEYQVEVNSDVEKVVISAVPEDGDATVKVNGNENLISGTSNKLEVLVTAPDNVTTKNYILNVTKLESGVTDDNTITIANGQRIVTKPVTITVTQLPPDVELPSGFTFTTATYDGNTIEAYAVEGETNPEYYLFYGMNEEGESNIYRFDIKEKTVQRYFSDPITNVDKKNANLLNDLQVAYEQVKSQNSLYLYIVIGACVLILVLIIVLIVVVAKKTAKRAKEKYNNYDGSDDDDDDYYGEEPKRIKKVISKPKKDEEVFEDEIEYDDKNEEDEEDELDVLEEDESKNNNTIKDSNEDDELDANIEDLD